MTSCLSRCCRRWFQPSNQTIPSSPSPRLNKGPSHASSGAVDQRTQAVAMSTLIPSPCLHSSKIERFGEIFVLKDEKNWLEAGGQSQQFHRLLDELNHYQEQNTCALIVNYDADILMINKSTIVFTGHNIDDLILNSLSSLLQTGEEENADSSFDEIMKGQSTAMSLLHGEIDSETGAQKKVPVQVTSFPETEHNHIFLIIEDLKAQTPFEFLDLHKNHETVVGEALSKNIALYGHVYVFQPEYQYPHRGPVLQKCVTQLNTMKPTSAKAETNQPVEPTEIELYLDKACRIMCVTESVCALTGYKIHELIFSRIHILIDKFDSYFEIVQQIGTFIPKEGDISIKKLNFQKKERRHFSGNISIIGPISNHYFYVGIRKSHLARDTSFTFRGDQSSSSSSSSSSSTTPVVSPLTSLRIAEGTEQGKGEKTNTTRETRQFLVLPPREISPRKRAASNAPHVENKVENI